MKHEPKITYGEFIAPYVVMAEYLAFSAFINIVAFEIVKGWFGLSMRDG